jgi:hypothetical protein
MAMTTNPIARIPRRGLMSPQTSGRSFQARFGLRGFSSGFGLLKNRKGSTPSASSQPVKTV